MINQKYLSLLALLICGSLLAFTQDISGNGEEEDEGDPERIDKLKEAAVALSNSLAAVIGISNPVAGAAIAIGTIVLEKFIDSLANKNTDLWDQLESRIELKIGTKLSAAHVHNLRSTLLYPLDFRIKKGEHFGPADLDSILEKMQQAIPSNPEHGWNYDRPLMMVYYIPYMISGYHKLIKEKKRPDCALANHMDLYRSKVIMGVKEMMRKRYKEIRADTWSTSSKYRCNSKKRQKRSPRKAHCTEYQMIYEDNVTKNKFTMKKRKSSIFGSSWANTMNVHVRQPTVDFLFKEVVEKINQYFIPQICLENLNCKCPEKIRREEIDFEYPSDCFGSGECMFPAGDFGYGSTWCYDYIRDGSWTKATEIDSLSCMPVNFVFHEPLNLLD